MSRHRYHVIIRAVVDRPLMNLVIVLTSYIMLAITGLNTQALHSSNERFFHSLMFFIFGFAFSITLPWLLRSIIIGPKKNRYLSILVLVAGFWGLFFGIDFVGQSAVISLELSGESIVLLGISLAAIAWGAVWSERLPLATFLTIPIQILALMASVGLMARMGIGFVESSTNPLLVPACALILFATICGTIVSINLGRRYSHARSAGLIPRDAASDAVSNSIIYVIYSTSIGLLLMFLVIFLPVGLHPAVEYHSSLLFLGCCAIMFSTLGGLLILPGSMWILDQKYIDQHKTIKHMFHPIGFDFFWKIVRRLLPNPSAYALVFIIVLLCIVLSFSTASQPSVTEILFLIFATILSGVVFLSLRALLMAVGLLILPIFISLYAREFFSINTVSLIYNMVAYGLVTVLVGEIVRIFRDISASEKHQHETVMIFMKGVTGPFILCCGLVTCILVMAQVTNFMPNANIITIQFVIASGVVFILTPALAKILAARYGRF